MGKKKKKFKNKNKNQWRKDGISSLGGKRKIEKELENGKAKKVRNTIEERCQCPLDSIKILPNKKKTIKNFFKFFFQLKNFRLKKKLHQKNFETKFLKQKAQKTLF